MSRANRDRAAALVASEAAQRAAKAETERIEQEKLMTEKHMCSGKVWHGFGFTPCGKTAAYEHEEKWFCKIHHPPSIEAKREAKTAKLEAEWIENKKMSEAKQAAEAEIKRRADCYPNLLNALKLCALICSGQASSKSELIQALEQSRSAIKKATGATQ